MDDLSEEERVLLSRIQKNPRRVEAARRAGRASGAKKENLGRFKKGDPRTREMGMRGWEALKVSR